MRTPRARSQLAQRARHDGEHDVVDRAAERVLDQLEVGQLVAHEHEPPVRPDRHVERRLRRRVQPGPRDLADALDRLARDLERARRVRGRRQRAAGELERRADQALDAAGGELRGARLGLRAPTARPRAAPTSGTGSRSNSTVARSTPATPSTSAWWVLEISAKRLPSSPCTSHSLPQRLRAVQLLRVHARGERAQLLLRAGRGERRVAHVVLRG